MLRISLVLKNIERSIFFRVSLLLEDASVNSFTRLAIDAEASSKPAWSFVLLDLVGIGPGSSTATVLRPPPLALEGDGGGVPSPRTVGGAPGTPSMSTDELGRTGRVEVGVGKTARKRGWWRRIFQEDKWEKNPQEGGASGI